MKLENIGTHYFGGGKTKTIMTPRGPVRIMEEHIGSIYEQKVKFLKLLCHHTKGIIRTIGIKKLVSNENARKLKNNITKHIMS